LVYIYWRDMTKLRNDWFRSPEYIRSFYARTISITHVPRNLRSDQGINHILNGLKIPYPTTSVHIGRKVGELPELIEYHNRTVREFEAVLVKFFKNGKKGKRRPTIRIGGCCGLGGTEKDAIAFYRFVLFFHAESFLTYNRSCSSEKLRRTEAAVESYRLRAETRKPQNYGFASLAAVPYAHITAKKLARRHYKGTSITLAPNPKDIVRLLILYFY
jgi:calcium permeable stress-gated cation channel